MLKNILLVGSGYMAAEYARVLKKMGVRFEVAGRGESSAQNFFIETHKEVVIGGIESFIENGKCRCFDGAIVAVGIEELSKVTIKLIAAGIKNILVEKPAGLNLEEIINVCNYSKRYEASIYVAYNRRFYQSVQTVKKMIKNDGGLLSLHFEFTELTEKIESIQKDKGIKEEWLLANSSHVIDLAFFFAGLPKDFTSYSAESLPWHSNGAIFTGAGETEKKVLFSYCANWKAPGRWGIELLTGKNRYILKPLEKLQVQKNGSFDIVEQKIDDNKDITFKAGLFDMVTDYVEGKIDDFQTIEMQSKLAHICRVMDGRGRE